MFGLSKRLIQKVKSPSVVSWLFGWCVWGGEFLVCGRGADTARWVGERHHRDTAVSARLSITMHGGGVAWLPLLHRFLPTRLQNSANERHLDTVGLHTVIDLYIVVCSFSQQRKISWTQKPKTMGIYLLLNYSWVLTLFLHLRTR